VELAVLETGLGGRLDATNVIERPLVTAITRVAVDHEAWLGDDLASIAGEKAGILKPAVPCVVAAQEPVVDGVIDRVAASLGAPLSRPRHDGPSHALHVRDAPYVSPLLSLGLAGEHQKDNAACAVGALWMLRDRGLSVDLVRAVRPEWPGRLERRHGRPDVLFDAAHNPNGAAALARYLEADRGVGPFVLVFGAMKDKAWREMLALLRPCVQDVVLTAAPLPRAEDPARLAAPGDRVEPDVIEAVRAARELALPDGLVVVAGSVFVVAAARAFVLGIEGDPPIAM
jgi:dihydrofolate synthase/folylpolyglutamate synthase